VSQIPDPQTLAQLADAFERLQGRRADPAEDAHRRGLERMVGRLAGVATAALVGVSGWVALDPQGRYSPEHRQLGLQGLASSAAALVGAVAGYLARGRQ
jgi:hypothetical protein